VAGTSELSDRLQLRTPAQARAERRRLGFLRQPRVRWLSPPLLLKAGVDVGVSSTFGRLADKRELETAEQGDFFDYRSEDSGLWRGEELWIDYMSDTGDGWEATQTMAWLLGRERLPCGEQALPRGDLLLLGGDQVYPAPGEDGVAYEDRFLGPFAAASGGNSSHDLFVVPGNHDWYDGLVAFQRIFCRPDSIEAKRIGDWQTRQKRSYWALRLPHDWWIWAIDIQLDTYIDNQQLDYFERAAAQLGAGQRVVLLTAKPSWIKAEPDQLAPPSWRNLAYFERKMIRERGADLVATLTGDLHHYSRYAPVSEGGDPVRITAGGGGAYMSPTHPLPDSIRLVPARGAEGVDYERTKIYPDAKTSKRLSWGAFLIPWHNPGFALLLGAVYALIAATILGTLDAGPEGLVTRAQQGGLGDFLGNCVSGPSLVAAGLLVLVLFAHADFQHRLAKLCAGTVHALAHLALVVFVAYLVLQPFATSVEGVWPWLATLGAELVAGLVGGSFLFTLYIFVVHRWRGQKASNHTNEVFAGQGIRDYKNFLRIHLDSDGRLTIYPLGVDRICRRWDLEESAAGPRFTPRGKQPRVAPIEQPQVFEPPGRGARPA
jgi:Calcineurin-like phosphoesterase